MNNLNNALLKEDIPEIFREYCKTPSSTVGPRGDIEACILTRDSGEALNIELSGLQAACSVEDVRKARTLATLLIDEKGKLLLDRVEYASTLLAENLYSISFGCEERRRRNQKMLSALQMIRTNPDAVRLFHRINRPLINRLAENAIRNSLLLSEGDVVSDVHARRAVLMALLTTLRQSLGSCFATAPAILVQEEEPMLFLADLEELMGTAKLRRVVLGNEYSVPMSASWGNGDLQKPILLRRPIQESVQKIYRSPIVGQILQSLDLIPQGIVGESLCYEVFKLLERTLAESFRDRAYLVTSIDDIFQMLILQSLGLTRSEVEEFTNRPKEMIQQGVVITSKVPRGGRPDKDKAFRRYFSILASVRNRFKAEADCALLKTWEFTIASFAEVKFDLCRYNFYSSLGVNWDEAGGIGQVLYDIARKRVEETNLELEQEKEKFEAINYEVDILSRRLQNASTESEVQMLKMEFTSRRSEQQHIREVCEMIAEKANKVSNLHQFLIDQYDRLMKEYFQEVYDAELHDVQGGTFDDSPAGFRLIYKHGRTNPSLWTSVNSLQEYVDCLVSFITTTEQELLHLPEVKGIEAEFSSIITRLANHIRSDEFLESAFMRTAVAHGVRPIAKPLQNLDKIEKKPWVYTSGGSMNTLVGAYFSLGEPVEEMGRWVESAEELLAYCADTTRQALNRSGRAKVSTILMHSPTHAFILLPEMTPLADVVSSNFYSYSWIRNALKDPYRLYYNSCTMDAAAVEQFCETFSKQLPESIRERFLNESALIPPFLRPFDLGKEILHLFEQDSVLRHQVGGLSAIPLDSLLFELLPYTPREALFQTVLDLFLEILPKEARAIASLVTDRSYHPVSAKDLLTLIKTAVMRTLGKESFSQDIMKMIVDAMRRKRLLPPPPIIFADSNWVKDYFAFIIGPTSQEVELWSLNAYGTIGEPITNWKMWLNGGRKDRTWGLLVNTRQYLKFKEFSRQPARF